MKKAYLLSVVCVVLNFVCIVINFIIVDISNNKLNNKIVKFNIQSSVLSRGNPSSDVSNYPTYYDDDEDGIGGEWPSISAGDTLIPDWGNRVRNSILSVQKELGIDPSGIFATVVARFTDIEEKMPNPDFHVPGNLTVGGTFGGTRAFLFLGKDSQYYITTNSYYTLLTPYGEGQYNGQGYKTTRDGSITALTGKWDIDTAGTGTWRLRLIVSNLTEGIKFDTYVALTANYGAYNYLNPEYWDRGECPFEAGDNIRVTLYNDQGRGAFYFNNLQFTIELTFDE